MYHYLAKLYEKDGDSKKAKKYLSMISYDTYEPKLTTLIVTHTHWDHVGGYKGLLEINPQLKIRGNANFKDVLQRATREPKYKQFRSESYNNSWLSNFKHKQEEAADRLRSMSQFFDPMKFST